jgi:hypothetical protein
MFRLVSAPETIEEKNTTENFAEGKGKGESRPILDQYYSVQFSFSRMDPAYLFKLRNLSDNGLCILVKKDSTVFGQLKEGDVLDMEYNPTEPSAPIKIFKTQIKSKNCFDRFKGHSLVELAIIEN